MSEIHRLGEASAPLTDDELLALYPWPQGQRWVRGMMVTALDGAAVGADGLSGSVSSSADQRVFNAVRRHADAVLIGAQTMRAERYTPMRARPADAEGRAEAGQLSAPVVVVVSGSLDLPWELPIWAESAQRPLVLTSADAAAENVEIARSHTDLVQLPAVTPGALLHVLSERGLQRIVCEGGPNLLRGLVAEGLVDELDITLAPLLVGNRATPLTDVLPTAARFGLVQVLEGSDCLMNRYVEESR